MSQKIELEVEIREDKGKGASRRLRRIEGKIPAILYGGEGKKSVSLSIPQHKLTKALENEAFYTQVITLKIGRKKEVAILKDLQRHPAKPTILHADFLRVDKNQEIHVHVPLHFINEESCTGVKNQGGKINHQLVEVEVIALPDNIPEFIEVDMQDVALETILHLTDLKLPQNAQISALLHGEDHDLPVVSIHLPKGSSGDEDEAGSDEDVDTGTTTDQE